MCTGDAGHHGRQGRRVDQRILIDLLVEKLKKVKPPRACAVSFAQAFFAFPFIHIPSRDYSPPRAASCEFQFRTSHNRNLFVWMLSFRDFEWWNLAQEVLMADGETFLIQTSRLEMNLTPLPSAQTYFLIEKKMLLNPATLFGESCA